MRQCICKLTMSIYSTVIMHYTLPDLLAAVKGMQTLPRLPGNTTYVCFILKPGVHVYIPAMLYRSKYACNRYNMASSAFIFHAARGCHVIYHVM